MLALSDFTVLKKLGQGSYGEVFLAKRTNTQQLLAIKCIPKVKLNKRGEDNLVSEIRILQKLTHPHVVRLLDFSWDSGKVYLFLEYCAGGDLSNFIHAKRRLPENLVRRFLRQLGLALQYLRQKNIIHMDLKPQNILLTSSRNPVLKVTDFGFAYQTKDAVQLNDLRGTFLYMAPEIYCDGIYHPSCDLWSIGVILYECLFGKPPYSSADVKSLKEKLQKDEPIQLPVDIYISANCASLLRGLLKRSPFERLSHEEFFNHPYVDLKHAPTPESLDNALLHLERGHNAETSGDLKAAYEEFTHGLAHLVSAVEYESIPKQREELRQLAMQYFEQAEKLKARFKSGNWVPLRPKKPAKLARTCSDSDETLIKPVRVQPVTLGPSVKSSSPPHTPVLHADRITPPIPSGPSVPVAEVNSVDTGWLKYLKGLFVSHPDSKRSDMTSVMQDQSADSEIRPTPPPRPRPPTVHLLSTVNSLPTEIPPHTRPDHPVPVQVVTPPLQESPNQESPRSNPSVPQGSTESLLTSDITHETKIHTNSRDQNIQISDHSSVFTSSSSSSASAGQPNGVNLADPQPDDNRDRSVETVDPVPSASKINRLRRMSHTLCRLPQSDQTRSVNTRDRIPLSYVQQMSLLSDVERIFELKSMFAHSDTQYTELLQNVEEFYALLRTNQLQQALTFAENNFSHCLQVAKADTNEERRRAVLKELKLVLDFIEWGRQQFFAPTGAPEPSNTSKVVKLGAFPEELGEEVTEDYNPSTDSCCLS